MAALARLSQKRKSDDSKDPIAEIILAHDARLVNAWRKAVADLETAGIPKTYTCYPKAISWHRGEHHEIELSIKVRQEEPNGPTSVEYVLLYKGKAGANVKKSCFKEEEWDQLIDCLKKWLIQMREETDKILVIELLEDSVNWWKALLKYPGPSFDRFSLATGQMVLTWHSTDQRSAVTVDRIPTETDDVCGQTTCFRITKKTESGLCETVFQADEADTMKQVEAFLKSE